jgi:hypothetical protein
MITQATLTYFMIVFVINFWKIFLEYSWKNLPIFKKISFNSYYFVEVYIKNLAKNAIFKKIQIHLQVLLLLKNKCYDA